MVVLLDVTARVFRGGQANGATRESLVTCIAHPPVAPTRHWPGRLGIRRGAPGELRQHAVMTYQDLPSGIKDIPLTDAALQGDIIDLIIGDAARVGGCLGLMVCDADDRGLQPVVLTDIPNATDDSALRQLLDLLLPMVGQGRGSVLIGRGRPRGLAPTDEDRSWHQCAIDSCTRHGVRLLGFYLVTGEGIAALPGPLSAAS